MVKKGLLKDLLVSFQEKPEPKLKLAMWGLGTVVCHNLNIGGIISWFGRSNEYIDTGLPYPFARRTKFPWETKEEGATLEDKITEWAVPALASYFLVYHPLAIAQFIDAMIPF